MDFPKYSANSDILKAQERTIRLSVLLETPEHSASPVGKENQFCFLPLSRETFTPAMKIISSTFQRHPEDKPEWEMEEFLEPGKHTAELKTLDIYGPRYWVLCIKNQVVGVTGLYFKHEDDSEAVWGGWTAYDPSKTGHLSRNRYRLLRKVVYESYITKRKYLRLNTADLPEEQSANYLYDQLDFHIFMKEKAQCGKYSILYRQIELEKLAKIFKLDQIKPEEI